MIQKHCFECGTALIEKELEEEGIVPYCRNPSQQPCSGIFECVSGRSGE